MARKSQPSGYAALRRRYAGELEKIRERYEAAADENRRRARALESDYKVMARQFRKEVAILRRKGLLPTVEDARKAAPTSSLTRKLNRLYDVVIGRKRPVKVTPAAARKLRAEGIQIEQGRALVGPRHTVRGGELHERAGVVPGTPGRRVRVLRLGANVEEQVEKLLGSLGPDEYVGFDIGFGMSRLFSRLDHAELINYLQGGGSFDPTGMKTLTTHVVRGADAMAYIRARRQLEETALREERRGRRRRRRRRTRRGLRNQRGR